MRSILVIGGGIAGTEGALTLARGLPHDRVTLLTHTDVLHLTPDLLYVPAGISPSRIELPIRALVAEGHVDVAFGEVEHVDLECGIAVADTGEYPFDVLVAAPGAAPDATDGLQMQTLAGANLVRDRIDDLFVAALERDARGSIVIRAAADDTWSPPAYELAMLIATHRRMAGLERLVSITIVTAELGPFQWFEPRVADIVTEHLAALGIELATGVPESRFDDVRGDVVIDFGRLAARHVPGLPGRDEHGWYRTDVHGRVHPKGFVLGDAACHGYKSAFAVAWQARRMLVELGGSLDVLGHEVDGVPIDAVEHHVELGTRTLRIRLPVAANLQDPWLGHASEVIVDDRPPRRLAGLLLGEIIQQVGGHGAAEAHRALVTRPGSQLRQAAPASFASSHWQ
ncbi:MAG: hypothetical protein JWM86_1575 [Thermoleophilia bacterium]|nr:hypothetical protein [Thermoleophilia bacterium]